MLFGIASLLNGPEAARKASAERVSIERKRLRGPGSRLAEDNRLVNINVMERTDQKSNIHGSLCCIDYFHIYLTVLAVIAHFAE